jgi:hypothetical protein
VNGRTSAYLYVRYSPLPDTQHTSDRCEQASKCPWYPSFAVRACLPRRRTLHRSSDRRKRHQTCFCTASCRTSAPSRRLFSARCCLTLGLHDCRCYRSRPGPRHLIADEQVPLRLQARSLASTRVALNVQSAVSIVDAALGLTIQSGNVDSRHAPLTHSSRIASIRDHGDNTRPFQRTECDFSVTGVQLN